MKLELLEQLDDRQLKLALGCGLMLLVAAMGAYGVWPKVEELRTLQHNWAVLNQVSTTEQGAAAEIERLRAQTETLRKRLQGDMANQPIRQMESFIIGRLQTISWRNDVTLVAVEPAAGESVEMYREVLFRVELVGDYTALLRWLEDVATELGFVVIKEYQLNVAEDHPDNPPLKTRLLLAAYRVTDG